METRPSCQTLHFNQTVLCFWLPVEKVDRFIFVNVFLELLVIFLEETTNWNEIQNSNQIPLFVWVQNLYKLAVLDFFLLTIHSVLCTIPNPVQLFYMWKHIWPCRNSYFDVLWSLLDVSSQSCVANNGNVHPFLLLRPVNLMAYLHQIIPTALCIHKISIITEFKKVS